MNQWLDYSIQYANQRSYLDDLFLAYPTIPEGIRDIDETAWSRIEQAFNIRDNMELIKSLLSIDLFPIKDSYVAYFKRDSTALERNPNTVNRLCGRLYELGLNKIYEICSQPKETNRQICPMFKNYIKKKTMGIEPVDINTFLNTKDNAILDASDTVMQNFASEKLNYHHEKGLDFLARFNGKYVIGEAKFLTDFGGHQNAQFNDAISTITTPHVKAEKVAILDGVLYVPSNNKLYRSITTEYKELNIMSVLVLRDYLYQI